MTTNLTLELKSMAKQSKKTPAGIEQISYTCQLKGSVGNIQATLALKCGDLNELNDAIKQSMGELVAVTLENAMRRPV